MTKEMITKIRVGDSVVLTESGKARGMQGRAKKTTGTFLGWRGRSTMSMRVRRDGQATASYFHRDFWRLP